MLYQTIAFVSLLISVSKGFTCGTYNNNEAACTDNFRCGYNEETGGCNCISDEPLDIIFVMDASNSILNEGWKLEREFVSDVVMNGVGTNSRIGIIKYNEFAELKYSFSDSQNKNDISNYVNSNDMKGIKFYTKTRTAVQLAIDTFVSNDIGNKKLMVLITDGVPLPKSEDPTPLKLDLDANSIDIIAILVGHFETDMLVGLFDNPSTRMMEIDSVDAIGFTRHFVDDWTCPTVNCVPCPPELITARRLLEHNNN